MKLVVALFLAGAVLLLSWDGSQAAEQGVRGVAVYSDICVHPESGDLLGDRVVVMRFVDGDYVLFQTAEGVIAAPQVAKATVDLRGGDIRFSVLEAEKVIANFKGKMTSSTLTGSFDNGWKNRFGEKMLKLPKINDQLRTFPACN